MNYTHISLPELDLALSTTVNCRLQEFITLGKYVKKALDKGDSKEALDPMYSQMADILSELKTLQHTLLSIANKISQYDRLYPILRHTREEIERKDFWKNKRSCII